MSRNAVYKKKQVTKIDKRQVIEAVTRAVFVEKDMDEYENYFHILRQTYKISEGDFESIVWRLKHGRNQNALYHFDLDMYPFLNKALKSFVVINLYYEQHPAHLRTTVEYIKLAIMHTQGFQDERTIDKLEQWLSGLTASVRQKQIPFIMKFLDFIDHPRADEIADLLEALYPGAILSIRELPNFKEVLIFDHVVSHFQNNWSDYEKLIFFPIILWWKITMIIPMRTSEFCSLERNCTWEKDGEHFIKVPRIKVQARYGSEIEVTDTIRINKDLYDLVDEYRQLTASYELTPFLLSYDAYRQSDRAKKNYQSKLNNNTFESHQFYNVLHHFYDDIVSTKYGYTNLKQLRPMDTRHFAFCNMMLQGFNMLTIARVGGHNRLSTQMHYFSHLENLNESAIQYLYEQKKKFLVVTNLREAHMLAGNERLLRARSILKQLTKEEVRGLPQMEFGYCLLDPTACPIGDCRHAECLYIPEEEMTPAVYEWLSDESQRLERNIKEQLELMKQLSTHMSYNISSLEYDHLGQAELSYLSENNKRLREQKAWTDARRDIVKEYLFGGLT